jgi:extradiol dioxygenase family protein
MSVSDRNKFNGVDDERMDPSERGLEHRRIDMLANRNAMATIAVKDLASARKFYEGTLHLQKSGPEVREATTYKSGNSTIVVYKSQYAGTNKATAATWNVADEFETVVDMLKNAGVAFEHYDMPGVRREGDIHVVGDFKTAWFKDPDGNILNINNG